MNYQEANKWDYENGYFLTCDTERVGKLLMQWELFKTIPKGDIIEVGVFKGASLMRLAMYRNLIDGHQYRSVYGFDMFGHFPTDEIESANDKAFIDNFVANAGEPPSKDEVRRYIDAKGMQGVHLIEGNIYNTLFPFVQHKPEIALLNIDVDAYEPTKYALITLMPFVVSRGVVMLDDYAHCEGAKRACDEVLGAENIIQGKLYKAPHFFIKD